MSELISLILPLKPLLQPSPRAVDWWGRAAHALLLRAIHQLHPDLAQTLHDEDGLRPFTVSNLLGRFDENGALRGDQVYALRFTTYRPEVSRALLDALQPGAPLSLGMRVEMDYIPFEVVDPQSNPLPFAEWQALNTYAELSSPYLLAMQVPPRRIRLQFASPTTFKSEG
ncbi:MAG: hypothetical protein RML93_09665, partial [Anaerolineales bacterium]|nr:hypothetical protein [Anaerolineales bacterium]MDW8447543.1 hypothetical protein [Anaerolineales bacterium]